MPGIAGVSVSNTEKYFLCTVNIFSNEIKALIKRDLVHICQGQYRAENEKLIYTYRATIKQVLERLENKTREQQIGMIGELLFHVLWGRCRDDFLTLSPYFNLEDNNVKKGFDLVLMNRTDGSLWLTEVKSGERNEGETSTEKALRLFDRARYDIVANINSNKINRWQNALNGLDISHGRTNETKTVKNILAGNYLKSLDSKVKAEDQNVILVSGQFSSTSNAIEETSIIGKQKTLEEEEIFNRLILFSLHKSTFEKIVEYLKSESANV